LLAPCPTPKLEDHTLSAVRDCLFNIFAATLHIEGNSSNRNLRTRHAVVTGTYLSLIIFIIVLKMRAPSEEKSDDTKDSFYEKLEQIFGQIS
jgi:hypothetical protein